MPRVLGMTFLSLAMTYYRPIFLALFVLLPHVVCAEEPFPLREKFPSVKIMTIEQMDRLYNDLIIVDVRSKIEYDVIRISKAHHVPVAKVTFLGELEKLRKKNAPKKIVFYCNGHTCAKSYEAAVLAQAAGFTHVYGFDAGAFDWVKAYPERGALLNQSPVDLDIIISDEKFTSKQIGFDEFAKRAGSPGSIVIDMREPFQRDFIPGLPNIKNLYGENLISRLKSAYFKNRQLLVFDAVGRQVRWLQYYLEAENHDNYLFLENGVSSIPR